MRLDDGLRVAKEEKKVGLLSCGRSPEADFRVHIRIHNTNMLESESGFEMVLQAAPPRF